MDVFGNGGPSMPDGLVPLRRLGAGSAAVVHLCRDASGRLLAAKVSRRALAGPAAAAFLREAGALARLRGVPGILPVVGAWTLPDGRGLLLTGYAPHGSLEGALRGGPLPCPDATDLGIRLAEALGAAHEAGILHRDIKPSNVLLDADDAPMLADFGLATDLYDPHAAGFSLPWASPETLLGRSGRETADVYALAATVCAAATGRPPFGRAADHGGADGLRRRILAGAPSLDGLSLPADLVRVLADALAADPDERTGSATLFADRLRQVQRSHGWTARRPVRADVRGHGGGVPARRGDALPEAAVPEPPSDSSPSAGARSGADGPREAGRRRMPVLRRVLAAAGAAAALLAVAGTAAALWTQDGPPAGRRTVTGPRFERDGDDAVHVPVPSPSGPDARPRTPTPAPQAG